MSVLFNHGLRHELLDRNPVQWVRQSAKRKKIPAVLEIEEVKSLLGALDVRERTMVLLDVVTGLRASELFGLKWTDIDFIKNEISVTRSVVPGSCRSVQNGGITETIQHCRPDIHSRRGHHSEPRARPHITENLRTQQRITGWRRVRSAGNDLFVSSRNSRRPSGGCG
jgi:integrase